MAIGSGQLWGKGLNNAGVGSVKSGNFVAEDQTDFIFAVIGEELGFVGSMVIICLNVFSQPAAPRRWADALSVLEWRFS